MTPLYIDDCFAWLHEAGGGRGVIICPAMGVEELCLHRFMRQLATQLANAGLPTLRLDYQGTGDSAGSDLDPDRVTHWLRSIRNAVTWMRRETGVTEVALVGFRAGALLAAQAAAESGDIKLLALMASPASGKFYLREMRALSIFVAQAAPHTSVMRVSRPDVEVDVGGFPVTRETAAALTQLELSSLPAVPAPRVLLLNVPNAPGDKRVAAHFRDQGCEVSLAALPGYDEFQWNSSLAELPPDAFNSLVDWLSRDLPAATGHAPASHAVKLQGPDWQELPVRFGTDGALFGVFCTPVAAASSRALLFLNHGSNHHIGWGRGFVRLARRFAELGIASLRIDIAGLGDSPPAAGLPENQLFREESRLDARSALDWLEQAGYSQVTVLGHCAGAHLAFITAQSDPRSDEVIMVNLPRFHWRPGDSLAANMRKGFRPSDWYFAQAREQELWKRLLRGQVNYRAMAKFLMERMQRKIVSNGRDLLSNFLPVSPETREVRQGFRELAQRGTKVRMIYSAEDGGLDEIATHAGWHARRLHRLAGFSFTILPDADHNITAEHAFEAYASLLRKFLQVDARSGDDKAGSAQPGNA
jgi:pimeloyl-ACP methyl ester carboxylesterase